MLAQLAGYYSSRSERSALVHALFSAGQQGALYDPSDLSTLFQERTGAAATTPTGADDPVGTILDVSGNGNHATAPNDAARMLLRTDGAYWWLEPDGVDDELSFTTGITGNSAYTLHCVARKTGTQTGRRGFVTFGLGGTRQGVDLGYGATTTRYNYTIAGTADLTTGLEANFPGLVVQSATKNATRDHVYREQGLSVATVTDTANMTLVDTSKLGARYTSHSQSNIFGVIVRGALSTEVQLRQAEEWLASKAGVALA